jgi:hypothetical protein
MSFIAGMGAVKSFTFTRGMFKGCGKHPRTRDWRGEYLCEKGADGRYRWVRQWTPLQKKQRAWRAPPAALTSYRAAKKAFDASCTLEDLQKANKKKPAVTNPYYPSPLPVSDEKMIERCRYTNYVRTLQAKATTACGPRPRFLGPLPSYCVTRPNKAPSWEKHPRDWMPEKAGTPSEQVRFITKPVSRIEWVKNEQQAEADKEQRQKDAMAKWMAIWAASARKKPVRVSRSWKARKDAADALQARERELCGEPPSRTRLSRSDNAFCVQRSGKAPAWEIHGFQWKPEHEGAWNPAKDGLKPYSRRRPSSPELTLPPVWVTSDGSGIPTPEAAQGIPGWAWIVGGVVAAMALGGQG